MVESQHSNFVVESLDDGSASIQFTDVVSVEDLMTVAAAFMDPLVDH